MPDPLIHHKAQRNATRPQGKMLLLSPFFSPYFFNKFELRKPFGVSSLKRSSTHRQHHYGTSLLVLVNLTAHDALASLLPIACCCRCRCCPLAAHPIIRSSAPPNGVQCQCRREPPPSNARSPDARIIALAERSASRHRRVRAQCRRSKSS